MSYYYVVQAKNNTGKGVFAWDSHKNTPSLEEAVFAEKALLVNKGAWMGGVPTQTRIVEKSCRRKMQIQGYSYYGLNRRAAV